MCALKVMLAGSIRALALTLLSRWAAYVEANVLLSLVRVIGHGWDPPLQDLSSSSSLQPTFPRDLCIFSRLVVFYL